MDDKEFLELHKNVTAFSRGEQPVFSEPVSVELPRLEDVENYVPEENVAQTQQNIPELDMEQINANAENTVNQYFQSGNEDSIYDDNDLQNVPVGEETSVWDAVDQSDTMKAVRRSNAYKRYMYNGEEVIAEARKISKAMNVDEGLILSSPEALDNMRDAYKVYEKEKDIDKVYDRFPGLKGLAEKDEGAAAIALSNMEDVKVAHGIIDSIKAGIDSYRLQFNRNKIGTEGFYGKSFTAEDLDNIKKAEEAIKNAKELPEFFDAPIDNAVGETVQQLTMMGSQFARGSYLAGAGAFAGYFGTKAIGTFFGGGPLGSIATSSLARQNAMRGMAIGARIGGTKEMFDELAGQYYLDALQYRNKAGGQQFTENEARLLAGIQAGIETAIEVADTEAVLKVLGKNPATAEAKDIIKDIVKNAKSPESAIALLKTEGAAIISKMFKTGKIEALEEGKQQLSTDLVGNVFAAYVAPDGDEQYGLTVRGPEELVGRATEATVQAFVPSMGMGAIGAGFSTVRAGRNFIGYMQMEEALNEVKLDFNNWTKNTNGVNMLRQLKENFANTKLAKEHPEEAQALLKETLKDSGYEEVVVDTELFKKEEGGSEILYQLASAVGMSEEQAKTAIDNNENIVVPTDVYAKSVMDNPIADKLLDKISFDKEGDCLERCRKYAASMKHAWDKMIDAESMRKMEAAYNVLKDTIGEDDALDAMGIVQLYPEDPAAGARKKVQEQQQEINSLLKPVLDEMNKDIHKGVTEYYRNTETGELHNPEDVNDLFGKEEMKSGGSYERVVVSNNAIWYQNFVKAHGRVPTKTEMIQIAEDVFTGNNEYGVPGWEVNDIETEEAAEANARMLANLRADMAMYERLAEKLKDYDASKVAAAEGLSESGYAAYKYLVNAIQGGEMNKATQRSAAVGAMLWAHVAERYAEAYQAMGQDVTALDVIKRFKFSNKDSGAGYNQQRSVYNYTYEENQQAIKEWVKNCQIDDLPSVEMPGVGDEFKELSKVEVKDWAIDKVGDLVGKSLTDPVGEKIYFEPETVNGIKESVEEYAHHMIAGKGHFKNDEVISKGRAVGLKLILDTINNPTAIIWEGDRTDQKTGEIKYGKRLYLSLYEDEANILGQVIVSVDVTDKGRVITSFVSKDGKGNKNKAFKEFKSKILNAQEIYYFTGRPSRHLRQPTEQRASTADASLHSSGNFILPQFFEDVKKNINDNTLFQKNQGANVTELEKTLVAYHNITGQDLMRAIDFGGFPVPSLAIMKKDVAYDKYGEITLVGTRDMIDPSRGVPVYAKDGYTITFPKPSYAVPKITTVRKFKDKWKDFFYSIDDAYAIDRLTDDYKYPERMAEDLRNSFGFQYYYLTKVLGKNIEVPVNEYVPRLPILKNEAYFKKLYDIVDNADRYDDFHAWERDIDNVVKEYYDERISKVKLAGVKNKLIEDRDKILGDGPENQEFFNRLFGEFKAYNMAKNNPGKDYRALKTKVRTEYSDIIYGNEYNKWADEQIKELLGEGKVKIGNKLYPFTLENVTKYMVKNAGAAAEASFNFSAGKVAALAAQKFKNIDEMHKAEGKLGSEDEFNKSADAAKEIGDKYRAEISKYGKYSSDSIFDLFDEAMESLAKASDNKGYTTIAKLRNALKKTDAFKDDIPDDVLQLGVDYLKALTDTTTQYFEAKPQRAIDISEFAGAVVPSDADPALVQRLQAAGLQVEVYPAKDNAARQAATQRIQNDRENVLFQSAGQKALTANQKMLEKAIDMYFNQGKSMQEVYRETGWHYGLDGKWRFEIPDNLDLIKVSEYPLANQGVRLEELYPNNALYAAYPWLKDILVVGKKLEELTYGYADSDNGIIALNAKYIGNKTSYTIKFGEHTYTKQEINGVNENYVDENGRQMPLVVERAVKVLNVNKAADNQNYIDMAIKGLEYAVERSQESYEKAINRGADQETIFRLWDSLEETKETLAYIKSLGTDFQYDEVVISERDDSLTDKELAGTLIHEIQHLIQAKEGFAKGGSPKGVMSQIRDEISKTRNAMIKIHPEAFTVYDHFKKVMDALTIVRGGAEKLQKAQEDYNNIIKEYNLSRADVKRIESLGAAYDKLNVQLNWENDEFTKYQFLHGEGEARRATEKAKISTELAKAKELHDKTYTELAEEMTAGKSEEVRQQALRYAEIRDIAEDANAEWKDEFDQEIKDAEANPELADVVAKLDEKFDNDYTSVLNRFEDRVLAPINYGNAIIVFGGNIVAAHSLNQQGTQGSIEIKPQGEYVVHLLETADESTFMHEMSHGFYDMMQEMALNENAPEQIKKDYETLRKWAEWNPEQINEYKGTAVYSEFMALDNLIREAAENGSAKTVDENGNEHIESYQSLLNRWRQERFARGFEEYLRQGKAPTEGMKGIFSKFKNWLVKIYKGCVGVGAKPTEEVKAVMDRMIASQEEIDLAMKRAEILKWKEAGAEELLTKTSQEYYDNLLTKAREEAEAKVLKLAMKDLDAEEKAKYKAKLDKEREAATERIKQKPVFMIYQYLEQNPGLNVKSVAKLLGNMTEAEYKQQLKLEGGSLEKAVDRYMEAYQRELDDESKPGGEQYQARLRAAAEEAVVTSKYTDLIAAYELQTYKKAVQRIRRLEKRLADIEATDEAERKQAEAAIRKEEKARNEQEDRDTRVQDLRRELKSMKESIRAYGKNSQDEITQARYYANNRLDTLPVGEATDFRKWGNLAVRKHQEAMDMLNAGKLEEATKLQKDVLVYRMLEKRAYELNQKYEKKVTRMAARSRTIAREHSMDANDTYLYNHLLYLFGLAEKDAPKPVDFPGVRQQLLMTADGIVDDNVPESSWINPDDWLLNIITGETPMKDGLNSLTMEQFRDVEELMQYVYNAGKDRNSIKTLTDEEGNQITIEELNASIAFEAGKKRDLRDTRKNVGGDSLLENAMRAARQYKVELIKPETILNALGESAMKYLYNPLRQCTDKELRMNQELVKKQSAVFAQYRDDVIQAMGKKEGEKFLKDFSSKQQYVLGGMTRFRDSKLTHEELICLALNLGTEIGHKRVLDIYEMNEGKLRDLLYNLSGADWNLIQNIWDLHEEYWPELQKVTANVTGVTMEKQEARTFTVMSKDGVSYPIKGGYYHLAYDPTKNLKINEQKADERLTTQSGSNRRFSIGIGMTKERNQYEVKYALKLDLGVMQRALAETVHYISFYETVKDVNRLINTYEFAETVISYFGEEHYQTLQKWVKDAWALEPESKTALERLNAAMRANQTMSTLGFSMITAAENILNIAPMMAEIGPLNALKAVTSYYGQMMATGLTNPMAMFDQNAFIAEHSIFMAERGESIDPNIHKAQKDNGLNADNIIKKGFKRAEDGAFYFITQTDLMMARPLWMHEYQRVYNECIAKNMSPDVAERKAVQAGDAAVRHVFGSAADVDKAAVQRSSNELMKFATMFYSYFSTVHNAMVAKGYEYQEQRHKGTNMFKAAAPSLVWGAMMWYLLPAIGSAVMRAYFKGSDDDREPDALAKKIANALVSNMVGGLPFVRDIVPAAVDIFTGERMYGFRNVSAYEAAKQALMTVSNIVKAVDGDKDAFDVMRSLARVNVYMSRFPLTLANAMITAVQWFNESDLSDDEMAEYMRAMVMNQKPKK